MPSSNTFSSVLRQNLPKIPRRAVDSHKHQFGPVLVIGGTTLMPGAALLASRAALYSGAGLVELAIHNSVRDFSLPELLYLDPGSPEGYLSMQSLPILLKASERARVILIGPGMGLHPETQKLLARLLPILARGEAPLVLDADAIRSILGIKLPRSVVTPHPGEASRLLGISTAEVQQDRVKSAQKISEGTGGVVVLKGAGTVVCKADQGSIVERGTPYLATAGSGDVLAGHIAALIAQGLDCFDAALLGSTLHAEAGERAASKSGGPIVASLIIQELSGLVGEFSEK